MTRALKNAQQQVFHAEKGPPILDQESTRLVVDTDKLKVRVPILECFHLTTELFLLL